MAAKEFVEETIPWRAKHGTSAPCLAARLNARITLFVFFGLVSIVAMGAVLFLAERRMSRSIDNLVSSSSVLNW